MLSPINRPEKFSGGEPTPWDPANRWVPSLPADPDHQTLVFATERLHIGTTVWDTKLGRESEQQAADAPGVYVVENPDLFRDVLLDNKVEATDLIRRVRRGQDEIYRSKIGPVEKGRTKYRIKVVDRTPVPYSHYLGGTQTFYPRPTDTTAEYNLKEGTARDSFPCGLVWMKGNLTFSDFLRANEPEGGGTGKFDSGSPYAALCDLLRSIVFQVTLCACAKDELVPSANALDLFSTGSELQALSEEGGLDLGKQKEKPEPLEDAQEVWNLLADRVNNMEMKEKEMWARAAVLHPMPCLVDEFTWKDSDILNVPYAYIVGRLGERLVERGTVKSDSLNELRESKAGEFRNRIGSVDLSTGGFGIPELSGIGPATMYPKGKTGKKVYSVNRFHIFIRHPSKTGEYPVVTYTDFGFVSKLTTLREAFFAVCRTCEQYLVATNQVGTVEEMKSTNRKVMFMSMMDSRNEFEKRMVSIHDAGRKAKGANLDIWEYAMREFMDGRPMPPGYVGNAQSRHSEIILEMRDRILNESPVSFYLKTGMRNTYFSYKKDRAFKPSTVSLPITTQVLNELEYVVREFAADLNPLSAPTRSAFMRREHAIAYFNNSTTFRAQRPQVVQPEPRIEVSFRISQVPSSILWLPDIDSLGADDAKGEPPAGAHVQMAIHDQTRSVVGPIPSPRRSDGMPSPPLLGYGGFDMDDEPPFFRDFALPPSSYMVNFPMVISLPEPPDEKGGSAVASPPGPAVAAHSQVDERRLAIENTADIAAQSVSSDWQFASKVQDELDREAREDREKRRRMDKTAEELTAALLREEEMERRRIEEAERKRDEQLVERLMREDDELRQRQRLEMEKREAASVEQLLRKEEAERKRLEEKDAEYAARLSRRPSMQTVAQAKQTTFDDSMEKARAFFRELDGYTPEEFDSLVEELVKKGKAIPGTKRQLEAALMKQRKEVADSDED